MTARWIILGAAMITVSAAGLAGCTQATDDAGDYGTAEQGILNGVLADDTYAAVGAIVTEGPQPFPSVSVLCSGTLVADTAIVTARHCTPAMGDALAAGKKVKFNIGQLAYSPDQSIPITGWVTAPASPSHPGLLFDGGRDVAVAYLQHRPARVEPVALGEFSEDMIGSQFTIAGFGRDNSNFAGWRYKGAATARSLGGTWYPLLFDNNFGQFLTWYFTDAYTSIPATQAEAAAWWDAFELEPGFELLAGGLEGEALACFGDSGGPLLTGDSPDNLTLLATEFAGEASQSEICTRGAAYTVNNAEILSFINGAL